MALKQRKQIFKMNNMTEKSQLAGGRPVGYIQSVTEDWTRDDGKQIQLVVGWRLWTVYLRVTKPAPYSLSFTFWNFASTTCLFAKWKLYLSRGSLKVYSSNGSMLFSLERNPVVELQFSGGDFVTLQSFLYNDYILPIRIEFAVIKRCLHLGILWKYLVNVY